MQRGQNSQYIFKKILLKPNNLNVELGATNNHQATKQKQQQSNDSTIAKRGRS